MSLFFCVVVITHKVYNRTKITGHPKSSLEVFGDAFIVKGAMVDTPYIFGP